MTKNLDQQTALVLFSGGQDSSIALAWALTRYARVKTIGFDYGQRHIVELGARRAIFQAYRSFSGAWRDRLADDTMVDLVAFRRLGDTAMTSDNDIVIGDHGLPTTFVPGRNLAFLTFAGAHAYSIDAGVLVAGMSQTDYSGYPDCREDALAAQMQALRLGMEADIQLETPLMHRSKAESWSLAAEIGGEALVEIVVEHSHTCYKGVRTERHDWGYGCADCPACALRATGWADYQAANR